MYGPSKLTWRNKYTGLKNDKSKAKEEIITHINIKIERIKPCKSVPIIK